MCSHCGCSGHWHNYLMQPGQAVRASDQPIFVWCLWKRCNFTTVLSAPLKIRHLWQLGIMIASHRCLICTVLSPCQKKALRIIYTSDFRGRFRIKLARFWKHNYFFNKRTSLLRNRTSIALTLEWIFFHLGLVKHPNVV